MWKLVKSKSFEVGLRNQIFRFIKNVKKKRQNQLFSCSVGNPLRDSFAVFLHLLAGTNPSKDFVLSFSCNFVWHCSDIRCVVFAFQVFALHFLPSDSSVLQQKGKNSDRCLHFLDRLQWTSSKLDEKLSCSV